MQHNVRAGLRQRNDIFVATSCCILLFDAANGRNSRTARACDILRIRRHVHNDDLFLFVDDFCDAR